jgi:hypothetical protein
MKDGILHYRVANEVCSLNVPLPASRTVLVGRFSDFEAYQPLIEGREAVARLIEMARDNYIQAYAEYGSQGNVEKARILGERIKAMRLLGSADYALNLPGAFVMVSAISALIELDVGQSLEVGYYDFSSTPLRTAVRDTTGDSCLLLPGGISVSVRLKIPQRQL